MSSYESNIKKYYLTGIVRNFWFILAINILFWQFFNITYEQIGWFELLGGIIVLLFELPTGAVADLVSRKLSVFIGLFIGGIAALTIGISSTFTWFLFANLLWSFGDTFHSGAESALIYDSLKELNKEKEFSKVRGKYAIYEGTATIIGSILGPLLFLLNPRIPHILVAIGFFASAFIFLSMKEPPLQREKYYFKKHLIQIKDGLKYSITHSVGKYILFGVLITLPIYFFNSLFTQPYYLSIGYSIATLAIITPIIRGAGILASSQAHRFEKIGVNKVIFLISIIFTFGFLLMSYYNTPILIMIIILFYMTRDISGILFETYIHNYTISKLRATVLSVKSMLYWPMLGIGLVVVGKLAKTISLTKLFFYFSIISAGIYFLSLFFFRKKI